MAWAQPVALPPEPAAPAPQPAAPRPRPVAQPPFQLLDGDRVVLLGDTLIEREQEYGYVEAGLTAQFSDRQVTFRNLGWSADTPLGESRAGFDAPEKGFERLKEQLAAVKPTVVFLGYGMASSFDGAAGLSNFVAGMNKLIDTIQQLSTNKVRVVVLGPIRHEEMPAPLPNPARHNQELALYNKALKELSDQRGLLFVDLFDTLVQWDATTSGPARRYTDDGIHLTAYGYWRLADAIKRGLRWAPPNWWLGITREGGVRPGSFGMKVSGLEKTPDLIRFTKLDEVLLKAVRPVPAATNNAPYTFIPQDSPRCRLQYAGLPRSRYALKVDGEVTYIGTDQDWQRGMWIESGPEFDQAEQLRQAIVRKNELFFHRWRPQNQTYLFGFRSHEQGQNAREIPEFDPLVRAEEAKIAALRKPRNRVYELIKMEGADANLTVKTSPPPARVKSPEPDRSIPPQPLPSFETAPGFEVNLFAEDPLLAKPIQINFDPRGRLWVASSEVYPQIKPGQEANDKILVLEDTDGDGKADKSSVFADGLLIPTGVEPGDGGVYVGQSTELLFFKDTNGDGKADERRVVLSGFGTEDTHHILHTLRWGYDGQLYFNQSIYIHSHLETPNGVVRLNSGGVYHLRPPTMELGVFLRGFCNPWGHEFDEFGQSFVTDGAGFQGISFGVPGAMYFTYAGARRELSSVSPGNYPKFASLEIIHSQQFPDDWQGNLITCDFRAHRVVRFGISEQGSGYVTKEMPDLLRSTNITFRPIDVKLGPDGALYISDWANPIIQHGEVDFRDPRRDHEHGRIWRVTAKGRPLVERPKLVGAGNAALFDQLLSPNSYNRDQARRVLTERGQKILDDLNAWAKAQTTEPALLQALWMYQSVNTVEPALLKQLLAAKDPHLRAAATRVLGWWHDRVDGAIDLLADRVADEHPRVRLEATRALSQIHTPRAVELVLSALDRPMDSFVEYGLWLSINDLAPTWIEAIQSGAWKPDGHEKQLEYGLKAIEPSLATTVLAKLLQSRPLPRDGKGPWIELIGAAGGPDELRQLLDLVLTGGFDDAAAPRALNALAEAGRLRRARPSGDLEAIGKLFNASDEKIRAGAYRLAGSWKLAKHAPPLLQLAGDKATPDSLRAVVFASLREIGGTEVVDGLRALSGKASPPAIRRNAVVALAALDLEKSLPQIVDVVASTTNEAEALALWRALLGIKGVEKAMVRALPAAGLPETPAKAGLRVVRESGRSDPDLVLALARGGNLGQAEQNLTPGEMRQLLARVNREGDPARGEKTFRRKDLGCTTCHAVGGAGGKVGPDLTSIGASSPVDYLVESVLEPNKTIKEGYHSLLVTTKDGEEYSGILVREDTRELVLRNASNQEVSIPKNNIDNRVTGGSLMPSGLSDILSAGERIDLFRFLSELGKPGRYDASKGNVARVWRVHTFTTSEEQGGQARFLNGDLKSANWQTVYSCVDGRVPKDELLQQVNGAVFSGPIALYAAARFQVSSPGSVSFKLSGAANEQAWIDGAPVKTAAEIKSQMAAGIHTIVLKLDPKRLPDDLRLESADGTFLVN